MKILILSSTLFLLITSLISCKKYDQCCTTNTTYYNPDTPSEPSRPIDTHVCQSNMTKKEFTQFNSNNGALQNYNIAKENPQSYTNVTYSCDK